MSMASNKESNETFDFGIKSYIAQSGERKYRICNTTFILDKRLANCNNNKTICCTFLFTCSYGNVISKLAMAEI
jgi:hypothetical protein